MVRSDDGQDAQSNATLRVPPGTLGPDAQRAPLGRVTLVGMGLSLLAGVASTGHDAQFSFRSAIAAVLVVAPLGVGLAILDGRGDRSRASLPLLFGVPAAVAMGGLLSRSLVVDPIVTTVLAIVLVAYVVEASRLLAVDTSTGTITPRTSKPPARVERRIRVFRGLTLLAALAFVGPLACAVFGEARPSVLVVAAAGLLGTLACRAFLMDTLDRHLQRDPALVATLARLRRHARRGRPAGVFYASTAIAVLAMIVLVVRHRLGAP